MIVKAKLNTQLAIFIASFSVICSELVLVKLLSGIRIGFSLGSFFVYSGAILGLGLGNFLWLSSGAKQNLPWLERQSRHLASYLLGLVLLVVVLSLLLLQFLALGRFFEIIMASMYLLYPAIVLVYSLFGYTIAGIFSEASKHGRTVFTWTFDIIGSALGGILPVILLSLTDPPVLYFVPVIGAFILVFQLDKVKARKTFSVRLMLPVVLLSLAYAAVIPGLRTYDLLRSAYPREYSGIVERTVAGFRNFLSGGYSMEYIGWSPYRKLNYFESDSSYMVTYDNITTTALMKFDEPFRPDSLFWYPEHSERSLIIGAGCGGQIPILQDFSDSIIAVELDPLVVSFCRGMVDEDHFINAPGVNYLSCEGLSFLTGNPGPYSYILFPLTDTFITSAAQSLVKAENYLYTAEGLETSISSLTEDGCLVIALASAMNQYGSELFNRSFPTVAVHLYRNLLEIGVPEDNFAIAAASDYMTGGVFLVYDNSGLDRARFDSLLQHSRYADIVLTDSEEFIEFASSAELTSNDRPFFYIAGNRPPKPVLTAALFLVITALVPVSILFNKARKKGALKGLDQSFIRVEILYAIATGIGFMGMGSLLIQRVIPIFGVPYLAGTVVLSSLLAGAGIISFILAKKNIGWKGMRLLSWLAVSVVTLMAFVNVSVFNFLTHFALIPRIFLTFLIFLPVGTVLGGFFPKLLQMAGKRGEAHVILAYGTDVSFSIVGIVLSLVIPIVFGYRFMFLFIGAAYIAIMILLGKLKKLEEH